MRRIGGARRFQGAIGSPFVWSVFATGDVFGSDWVFG